MKPVLGMEGEKPTIITVSGIPDREIGKQPMKGKRNQLLVGVAIGLVAMVVVAAVVGLSVYFGAKITQSNYKEARQIFRTDDGKVVEEVTTVTDTEVSIRVPNEIETVYDYKNGLEVVRYTDTETRVTSACYAKPLNETAAPSTDPDRYTSGEQMLSKKYEEPSSQKWVSTNRKVSKHVVSESVATMCEDTEIFWMERRKEGGIVERSSCTYYGYVYVCYYGHYACSIRCDYDFWCLHSDGYLVLDFQMVVWYCLNSCNPGYSNPIC